jgi:hypothetical protein
MGPRKSDSRAATWAIRTPRVALAPEKCCCAVAVPLQAQAGPQRRAADVTPQGWRCGVEPPILPLMSASARWNLIVSRRTDNALRRLLARQGQARRGALSRFVEEAVQARILELEAEQAKDRNAGVPPEAIQSAVTEALEWARHA